MMIAVDFGPHVWTYPLCFVRFVRLFAHPIRFFVASAVISVGKPQPFLLALRNDRNLDLNGQNISWDLVDLSNMLFLCSILFVLCPQWAHGSMVPMALSNQGRA